MPPTPVKITIYGSPFCTMVGPVRAVLDRADVPYDYVDILRNKQAASHVREINNGFTSVPTIAFPDDSTLTEPTAGELTARLKALGYEVPEPTTFDRLKVVFVNPIAYFLGAVMLIFGFAGDNIPLIITGIGILALGLGLSLVRKKR